jgi:hypothetical protein
MSKETFAGYFFRQGEEKKYPLALNEPLSYMMIKFADVIVLPLETQENA